MMTETILRDLAEAAGIESLLISKFSRRWDILVSREQPTPQPDFIAGILSLLFAAGEKHLYIERWDAINHIIEPEWTQLSKWDEAKLSVETLLDMTSGLDEAYAQCGVIGESFRFEPRILHKLAEVIEVQTGQTLSELFSGWLADPLGLPHTDCHLAPVNAVPPWQFVSNPESIHQIGIAMLKGEHFDGSYLRGMRESAASTQPHFRLLWWNQLTALLESMSGASAVHSAPEDLIISTLYGHSCLAVSGMHDLVITALGDGSNPSRTSALELLSSDPFWAALDIASPRTN